MASAIITISKKTPQEELLEILRSLKPNFETSSVVKSEILDKAVFLTDVLACLPELLNGQQQEIWERFTLIGYLFNEPLVFSQLVDALESSSEQASALTALAFLYDLVGPQCQKFRIFKAIYQQARKGSLSLIQPHLLKIEDFVKSWSEVDHVELNAFIQEVLEMSVPEPIKSRLIVRLLADDRITEENADTLVGKYFANTEEYDIEKIIALPAYKCLSAMVKQLLQLLASASAPEVIKFMQTNENALKSRHFDSEKVLEICRVAGIIKLTSCTGLVTFQQISEMLSVSEDEVDYWVVRTVSNGMVKVKIDAINKVIYIEQSRLVVDKKHSLELLQRFENALRT